MIKITSPLLPDLDRFSLALKEVWDAQQITNNGKQHQLLEAALKKHLQAKNLVLFSNGTLALLIALKALNLKGKVVTTPFTFAATAMSINWANLEPVFCDIDYDTMCIDSSKIEAAVTKDTSAILPVHVYGNVCDVEKIDEISRRHKLKVIYDAAHAFGIFHKGKAIAEFGDISMFSFHATKIFNTIEGGCLTFADDSLRERIDMLKNFGIKNEEEIVEIGINAKMNEIQALIGLLSLELVDEERKKRKLVKDIYDDVLKDVEGLSIGNTAPDNTHYYPIRIKKEILGSTRDEVYEKLKKVDIISRKYFYPLLSNIQCYRDIPSARKENLKVANQVSEEILCLPMHSAVGRDGAKRVCDVLISLKC